MNDRWLFEPLFYTTHFPYEKQNGIEAQIRYLKALFGFRFEIYQQWYQNPYL